MRGTPALASAAALVFLFGLWRRCARRTRVCFRFITSSSRKVRHLKHNLAIRGLNAVVSFDVANLDIVEPQLQEIRQIALYKAREAFKQVQGPVLVEDSGFFLQELGGFPGSLARPVLESIGTKGLVKLMAGLTNRKCHYTTCAVFTDSKGEPHIFESINRGFFTAEPSKLHPSRKEGGNNAKSLQQNTYAQHAVQLHNHFISADSPSAVPEAALTAGEYQQYREVRSGLSCYGKFGQWLEAATGAVEQTEAHSAARRPA
jgi:non-canonical purine NTP pyrophosphatase (RdgB/HAM1 family)